MNQPENELFAFDSYSVDPAERRLLRDGKPVALEPKVFETLLVLIRRSGQLVEKEELMRAVWPDSFVEESNLTRNVSMLRKALSRSDGGPQYIETVPTRGYRFVGQLRPPESGRAVDAPPAPRSRRRRLALGAAVTLILTLAAIAAIRDRTASARLPITALAVLPLESDRSDPEAGFVTSSITDSLIDRLSQVPGLTVMSRSSVFNDAVRAADARTAGKLLAVPAVLAVRVVIRGERVLISTELVDVRDNSHLWGEEYDRKRSELLDFQREIPRDVAEKLRRRLSGQDLIPATKPSTESAQAYELYLKGRYMLNRQKPDERQALSYFERAVALDPGYGAAYAAVAESYARLGSIGTTFTVPRREAFAKAKAAAVRAVEQDDTLAEAHASLGLVAMLAEWDWKGAEREFRRALTLDPSSVTAHHLYSHYLISMRRFDESLAESLRALALDPLDVGMNLHLGVHYYSARQYEQAATQLRKTLLMDQNHSEAHTVLALVQAEQGRYEEAIGELRKSKDLGGVDSRASLGRVYAIAGQGDAARQVFAELQKESSSTEVSPYALAVILAGLHETDRALSLLEQACAAHDSNLVNLAVDPAFDGLRAQPRFGALLLRVGLGPGPP